MTGPQRKQLWAKVKTGFRYALVGGVFTGSIMISQFLVTRSMDGWFVGLLAGVIGTVLILKGGKK